MSKILVTGGSGFLGSNLCHKLINSKNDVHLILRPNSNFWRITDVKKDLNLHNGNLSKSGAIKSIIKKIKPDIVFHCASYGVYPKEKNFKRIFQTNVLDTINLMNILSEYGGLKKFVNLGSVSEYGPKKQKIKETDLPRPVTPYSIAKLTQTNLAQYFAIVKQLPTITLRIFTPYGKYDNPGRLISDVMLSIIKKKKLELSSPLFFRDFIFIDDAINAIIKAANSKCVGEIINVGSGRAYSIKEIIEITKEIGNLDLKVSWGVRAGREFDKIQEKSIADISKAKKLLNWKPFYSIREGLHCSYIWYKKNYELYAK